MHSRKALPQTRCVVRGASAASRTTAALHRVPSSPVVGRGEWERKLLHTRNDTTNLHFRVIFWPFASYRSFHRFPSARGPWKKRKGW